MKKKGDLRIVSGRVYRMWVLSKGTFRVQSLLVVFGWGLHDRVVPKSYNSMSDQKQQPHRRSPTPLVAFLLVSAALLAVTRAPPSHDYALCSTAAKIYTVDTAHPNVECIVVSNTTIADVGGLGGSTTLPFLSSLTPRSRRQSTLALPPYYQLSRQLSDTMASRLLAALATRLIRGT